MTYKLLTSHPICQHFVVSINTVDKIVILAVTKHFLYSNTLLT